MIGTDEPAFAVGEEMVEVPGDGLLIGGALEECVDRMHFRSVDAQLLIERDLIEAVGELLSDEVLDGMFIARLLAEELVAWEEEDFKVSVFEFLLEFVEVSILREGFTSRRRDIDSQDNLVAESSELIDILRCQATAAEVVEARRNVGKVVASMRHLHDSAAHVSKKGSQNCDAKENKQKS